MTPALQAHIEALGERGRERTRRESIEALRLAWPHRHGLRGRTVVRSNLLMLQNLREWR